MAEKPITKKSEKASIPITGMTCTNCALTVERALEKTGGQRGPAARLLGISRTSLWRKMKAYGLI